MKIFTFAFVGWIHAIWTGSTQKMKMLHRYQIQKIRLSGRQRSFTGKEKADRVSFLDADGKAVGAIEN